MIKHAYRAFVRLCWEIVCNVIATPLYLLGRVLRPISRATDRFYTYTARKAEIE